MPEGSAETGELLAPILEVRENKDAIAQLKHKLLQLYLEVSASHKDLLKLRDQLQVEEAKSYIAGEASSLQSEVKKIADAGREIIANSHTESNPKLESIDRLKAGLKAKLEAQKKEVKNFGEIKRIDEAREAAKKQYEGLDSSKPADDQIADRRNIIATIDREQALLPNTPTTAAYRERIRVVPKMEEIRARCREDNVILEKIKAFEATEKSFEKKEEEVAANNSLPFEEKVKTYSSLGREVHEASLTAPPATSAGAKLLQKINTGFTNIMARIGYKMIDLNIAKTCRERYSKYVSVDDKGNISYTEAFKTLKTANPAEYKKIMNEIIRGVTGMGKKPEENQPDGTDFMKLEAELTQLNRKMDEYKKAVEEFEKNPGEETQQRMMAARPVLQYPGFPGSGERSALNISGGEFLTDMYSAVDRVGVPYKKLQETMAALDERAKNKEVVLNKEAITQLMTALDSNWNEMVKPKTAEYSAFKTSSMAEYLSLLAYNELLFTPEKKNVREKHRTTYDKISEEVLRSALTVEMMISPFMAKNLDAESRAKLDVKYKETEKLVNQVENDRLIIKSTQSLQKIETSPGVNVLSYVIWKPGAADGKNYEIDEHAIPVEKRDMVRSQIRLMIAQNIESVKNETGTAIDDLQKVDPQKAIAKMREQYGEKGKLFFDAVQMMESGDLNAAAKGLRDFIAFSENGKFSAEETVSLGQLKMEAQDKLKLISARQIAMLETLQNDIRAVFSPLTAAIRSGRELDPQQKNMIAGEEGALNDELNILKGKVQKGEILDINAEVASIKQKLATGATRYGMVEKIAALFQAQNDLHSSDPVKKAAAIKELQKFADNATDMDTRLYDIGKKYLDMILEERKKESEDEANRKGVTRESVGQSIVASPAAMAVIKQLAKQYYDNFIKENPNAKEKITMEQAEQFVLRRKTDEQYSASLRQSMSSSPKYKDDPTLKMYDKWFPLDQARFWEVWKYSLEEQHLFADECAKLVYESILTLPVGMGAGAVGKMVTRMALRGMMQMAGERAGLEAGLLMMERGGLLALRAGSAEMEMLSPALRAAVMKGSTRAALGGMGSLAWGAGVAGEGATMHVLGGMTSFLSSGELPLYLQAQSGAGSHRSFAHAMSESMVKAMMFRFMGQAGQKVFGAGMQAGGANATASYLAMESFSGAGGTAIELASMDAKERQKQALNPTYWVRSMMSNAIVSAGTHYAHGSGGEHDSGSGERLNVLSQNEQFAADFEAATSHPRSVSDTIPTPPPEHKSGTAPQPAVETRSTSDTIPTIDIRESTLPIESAPVSGSVQSGEGRMPIIPGQKTPIPGEFRADSSEGRTPIIPNEKAPAPGSAPELEYSEASLGSIQAPISGSEPTLFHPEGYEKPSAVSVSPSEIGMESISEPVSVSPSEIDMVSVSEPASVGEAHSVSPFAGTMASEGIVRGENAPVKETPNIPKPDPATVAQTIQDLNSGARNVKKVVAEMVAGHHNDPAIIDAVLDHADASVFELLGLSHIKLSSQQQSRLVDIEIKLNLLQKEVKQGNETYYVAEMNPAVFDTILQRVAVGQLSMPDIIDRLLTYELGDKHLMGELIIGRLTDPAVAEKVARSILLEPDQCNRFEYFINNDPHAFEPQRDIVKKVLREMQAEHAAGEYIEGRSADEAGNKELRKAIEQKMRGDLNHVSDELNHILGGLKTRDALGYQILEKNVHNMDKGYLKAVIEGRYSEWTDRSGNKVRSYRGGSIASGGMGSVSHVMYYVDGKPEAHYAVIKTAHDTRRENFRKEKAGAETVQSWFDPNDPDTGYINRPLHIGEDFIIYETGPNPRSLMKEMQSARPAEIVKLVRDLVRAVRVYQSKGYFHADIKPENILIIDTPDGPKAILIDNTPIHATNDNPIIRAGAIPVTPPFFPMQAFKHGVQQNPEAMFRIIDNHAIGQVLEEFRTIARKRDASIDFAEDFDQIIADAQNPAKNVNKDFIDELDRRLERVQKVEMEIYGPRNSNRYPIIPDAFASTQYREPILPEPPQSKQNRNPILPEPPHAPGP